MRSRQKFWVMIWAAGLGCHLVLPSQTLHASPVSTRLNKVYKELVIQGERPEISSCMALAFKSARENGPYEQIYYAANVQDSALVQEDLHNGHLVKTVTLRAQGEPRQGGFYLKNSLEKIDVVCIQMDEGMPVVRFKSLGKD